MPYDPVVHMRVKDPAILRTRLLCLRPLLSIYTKEIERTRQILDNPEYGRQYLAEVIAKAKDLAEEWRSIEVAIDALEHSTQEEIG